MDSAPTNGDSPVYLTPLEAAEILRVDRRTIYEWLETGKLKAKKIGGTWRIPRAEVFPPT